MDLAIKPTKAVQIRLLKDRQPYLTEEDIVKLTGFTHTEVKGALRRQPKDKPKTRAR